MLLVYNEKTDPAYNLALEETLLTCGTEEYFVLWRNRPTVVIGRHQDALAEIDLEYLNQENVRLVRRMSGGGAVYHDLGNVNYSYLSSEGIEGFADFSRFCRPVLAALSSLGVQVELSGRNDLTIEGKKISGNAQYRHQNRLLHHGTLLYSTDFSQLSKALKPDPEKLQGKGVQSVRSRVCNISEYMQEKVTVEEFISRLQSYILGYFDNIKLVTVSEQTHRAAEALAERKYRNDAWTLGHNKEYQFKNSARFPWGRVLVSFNVKEGAIEDIKFSGDFFSGRELSQLESHLCGVLHTPAAVAQALNGISVNDYISGSTADELRKLIF